MKLQKTLHTLALVLVLLAVLDRVDAKGKKRNKNKNGSVCKYKKRGIDSECNDATGTKQVTLKLKGRRNDPSCEKTKTVTKPCDYKINDRKLNRKNKRKQKKQRCKYDKRNRQVSQCDHATNTVTITLPLKANQDLSCEPVRTKTKQCRPRDLKRRNGCVYNKQPWSECNSETNTRQREMVLVEGEATQCLPKKIVTKKCRKACRYMKEEWGTCDLDTNLKQRTLTPKPGSAQQCESTVQTRPCRQAELTAPKSSKCKYNLSVLSECDPRTNTMTQMMSLKSGDPNVCMRSKKLTRKCKIACKFRRGEWSECDEKTELATRVDNLVKGNAKECEQTREITKKCKKACKYTFGDWGECDPKTNLRTRVKNLIKGDSETCNEEELVSKPCTKRDGGERCFFGSWEDFGPCNNGVSTKRRPVTQGGLECQRKAVTTKACTKTNS